MNRSVKAALISALVFPGFGHVFLKKYMPGLGLTTASLGAVFYLVSKTVERAMVIAEQIQSGSVPLDTAAITELLSQPTSADTSFWLNVATAVILLCWLIGIIDAYRVGRTQDLDMEKHDAHL